MPIKILAAPLALGLAVASIATPATAAEVSTHILDLSRGTGRGGVPVTLARQAPDGGWTIVGRGTTDAEGRVRQLGEPRAIAAGIYRLQFDMAGGSATAAAPFFPEIILTFRVTDAAAHYHVPVVVSPYGYSTYRGS